MIIRHDITVQLHLGSGRITLVLAQHAGIGCCLGFGTPLGIVGHEGEQRVLPGIGVGVEVEHTGIWPLEQPLHLHSHHQGLFIPPHPTINLQLRLHYYLLCTLE